MSHDLYQGIKEIAGCLLDSRGMFALRCLENKDKIQRKYPPWLIACGPVS